MRYVRRQNGGMSAGRNTGVEVARSEWVAFLDDDDEWVPEKTQLQEDAIAVTPGAAVCYGGPLRLSAIGKRTFYRPPAPARMWPGIRLKNLISPCTMMVRRDAFKETGGFDERLRCGEDWEFNVRLIHGRILAHVDAPLVHVHEVCNSTSKAYLKMLQSELSIVDRLLHGMSGIQRVMWRQRILSCIYYRAAVSAREASVSCWPWLLRSLLHWPSPTFEPVRYKVATLELLRQLSGNAPPASPAAGVTSE